MTTRHPTSRRAFLRYTIGTGAASFLAPHLMPSGARAGLETNENDYKIGIYTRPWGQYDYRVALDAVVGAGFRYVGLMSAKPRGTSKRGLILTADTTDEEAAEVAREVRQRGLTVASVYGGGIPVNKSLQAGIDGLRRIVDSCVTVGARSLLMGGIGNADLYDRYYKAIAECCDYAAEKHLPITVKPHGGLNATGALCRKCIESVAHPNFSLWYDPGNIFYYSKGQLDPVDDAKTVAGLVKIGICIKDFQMTTKGGKTVPDVLLTPGTGRVDFPRVLSALEEGGFSSGYLVVECLSPGDGALPSILAEAKKAKSFCEQLVAS